MDFSPQMFPISDHFCSYDDNEWIATSFILETSKHDWKSFCNLIFWQIILHFDLKRMILLGRSIGILTKVVFYFVYFSLFSHLRELDNTAFSYRRSFWSWETIGSLRPRQSLMRQQISVNNRQTYMQSSIRQAAKWKESYCDG